ncbi:MAG: hypothetical protein MUQ56_03625 [Thermoleophilia bacterium]|nr:hypothetical protein [Thermoleophilia bacterium]
MAFVVWLIAKEGELVQQPFAIPLRITNLPDDRVEARVYRDQILVSSIHITVGAPKNLGAQLMAEHFGVELDWRDLTQPKEWPECLEFTASVMLGPESIALSLQLSEDLLDRIRRNVQYLAIEPRKVTIKTAYITRPAAVMIQPRGKPARGYELAEPLASFGLASNVSLTASQRHFVELGAEGEKDLVEILTEDVDLEGRKESYVAQVGLILPVNVSVVPGHAGKVPIRVEIRETLITRTIQMVAVEVPLPVTFASVDFSPRTADVTVRGPMLFVEKMEAAHLVVRPTRLPENPKGEVALGLAAFASDAAPKMPETLEIQSVAPATVKARFEPRNPEKTQDIPQESDRVSQMSFLTRGLR